MLFIGSVATTVGLVLVYFVWTIDWWQPMTITGTRVGIEDIIMGMTNGGLGAVLYEAVFKRRTRSLRKDSKTGRLFIKRRWLLWVPVAALFLVGSTTFWALGWHSFSVTTFSCLIGAVFIVLLRRDLLFEAIFGGLAMVLVTLPVYRFGIVFFPGVIEEFWFMQNLTGIMIWGIPIEELVFYFAAGALAAPLYEFLFEKKLVKLS